MTEMQKARIAVVGGGLAGMIAALKLQQLGCQVTVFDMADRLGGKAGATQHGDDYDEHGYHIFPDWYHNAQHLAKELGLTANFVDCTDFFQLEPGAFPKWEEAWAKRSEALKME